MKIKLQLERRDIDNADGRGNTYTQTHLIHIKVMDEGGHYIAFAQHTPALIKYLTDITLEVPDVFLIWKGHNDGAEYLAALTEHVAAKKKYEAAEIERKAKQQEVDALIRGAK